MSKSPQSFLGINPVQKEDPPHKLQDHAYE